MPFRRKHCRRTRRWAWTTNCGRSCPKRTKLPVAWMAPFRSCRTRISSCSCSCAAKPCSRARSRAPKAHCATSFGPKPILYLSHYLKAHRTEYYRRLRAVRDDGAREERLKFFIASVAAAAFESTATARAIVALREEIRDDVLTRLGRAAANALRLCEQLFNSPVIGVPQASELLGTGYAAGNRLIDRMAKRGILVEVTGNSRNRRFAFQRYIALFDD